MWQRGVECVECTDQVDVDDTAPLGRIDHRDRGSRPGDAGVGDHDIDRPEMLHDGRARRLHGFRRCNVSLECHCSRTEFVRKQLHAGQVAIE